MLGAAYINRLSMSSSYPGKLICHDDKPTNNLSGYFFLLASVVDKVSASPRITLDYTENTIAIYAQAFVSSYGKDFIFNRIWVSPSLLPIGFIVEEVTREIWIWNAYQFKTIDLTAVDIDFEDGISISGVDNLPQTLPISWDRNVTLTIEKDGPTFQNSIITFTIDGKERTVTITGFRTLVFDADPNWLNSIQKKISFHSSIATHRKLWEQRRALSKDSWWDFGFNFMLQGTRSQKVFHMLSFGKDRIIAVPVYDEKLTIESYSEYSITVNETLPDNYYYLTNKNLFLIITDHEDKTELKEILTYDFDTRTFTFEFPIREDFNQDGAWVYPVVMSSIKALSFEEETADLTNWKIDFQEIKANV